MFIDLSLLYLALLSFLYCKKSPIKGLITLKRALRGWRLRCLQYILKAEISTVKRVLCIVPLLCMWLIDKALIGFKCLLLEIMINDGCHWVLANEHVLVHSSGCQVASVWAFSL